MWLYSVIEAEGGVVMSIDIFCCDVRDYLAKVEDESIDCVITDPPYRVISGGRNDNLSRTRWRQPCGILRKNDGKIFAHNSICFYEWVYGIYRVLKENSDFYCMTNCLNLYDLLCACRSAGFNLHNILVWEKNNATPNRWYMKNCEYILYFYKGRAKPINNLGTKTVLRVDNVAHKYHPTQKPVELMKIFVENSTRPGDLVFDPFMGSGSTGIACKMTDRNFIGVEIDKKYFDNANELLNGGILCN